MKIFRAQNLWMQGYVIVSLVFVSLMASSQPILCEMPDVPSSPGPVFVKVILPMEEAADRRQPVVEHWVAQRLAKRDVAECRAVTDWVCLAEKREESAAVWNAVVDGKTWGCPVNGRVVERTADGKLKVQLTGWTPVGAEVKGTTFRSETGTRRIAVVNPEANENLRAYIAILVGPPSGKHDDEVMESNPAP